MSVPQEHDYITCLLSEAPPMEKLAPASDNKLRETELRLGLPGFHSPPSPSPAATLFGQLAKSFVSGSKRGFSDDVKEVVSGVVSSSSRSRVEEEEGKHVSGADVRNGSPASKAQVVGWPPIRSFRKNTLASNMAKNDEEAEGKTTGFGCLYVKVSMEGAPYLRKVDLKTYSNYMELSSALEKMFSCFTIGKCSSQGLYGNETSLKNLLRDSENVLTYEDKDGDWMLVGDVPWEMFTESCKKLRIMKGSEAIGLAPRAMEKCKNRS